MTAIAAQKPWYATNARSLLEQRKKGLKPTEPVVVSMVGGDFRGIADTVLYAHDDMPVDRMDWRMLVDLEVWAWASPDAAIDRVVETVWRIAQARPRQLLLRFECKDRIHDIDIGSGCHRPAVAGLPPEHGFWWLPINVGGTPLGYRILKSLTTKKSKGCTL